ncbi:hypothetical protein [Lacticaseibacillus saniviri]|uniref:Uncharacterized protein n=1 Tax=Lacticaseibacillus saniviri JCM 17471 = DSM 24301 TaxID=1293598 RepID=A0A0R2MYJ5_9LACO|nr:hypothetical protein [Lacticaseibacillus saniviri]KRO17264.1 hypothetical protein IV56_GL000384 [Lacticaseibacillus saniviri JCM 17471 = DSM 24301]MCG4282441.1 hypothetical protein [Lacticaseibacillus saniviri]
MPIHTLSEDELLTMSATVISDVSSGFKFPYYVNDLNHDANFDLEHTKTTLELELTLLNDPDPKRSISFYSDGDNDPVLGGAANGQVLVRHGATFIYLNDGYMDSYVIILKDGAIVQNLKLEQQILSGPEVESFIDEIVGRAESEAK